MSPQTRAKKKSYVENTSKTSESANTAKVANHSKLAVLVIGLYCSLSDCISQAPKLISNDPVSKSLDFPTQDTTLQQSTLKEHPDMDASLAHFANIMLKDPGTLSNPPLVRTEQAKETVPFSQASDDDCTLGIGRTHIGWKDGLTTDTEGSGFDSDSDSSEEVLDIDEETQVLIKKRDLRARQVATGVRKSKKGIIVEQCASITTIISTPNPESFFTAFTITCAVRRADGIFLPFSVPSTITYDDIRRRVAEKIGAYPELLQLRYKLEDSPKALSTSITSEEEFRVFTARMKHLIVPPLLSNGKSSKKVMEVVRVIFEDAAKVMSHVFASLQTNLTVLSGEQSCN
jgi:hypothetical protein